METFVQDFHEVNLLFLDILLEGITNEVDVFSLTLLFVSTRSTGTTLATCVCRRIVEGLLFLKLVKTAAVIIGDKLWSEWRFGAPQVFPVKSLEEGVRFNFVHPIQSQSMVCITHQSFENVSRRGR